MNIAAGLSKGLERETFSREVLDAVGVNIAVLDRNGVIRAVNRTWQEFARNNGDASGGSATGVGVDYLAVVKASHGASREGAAEALIGIQDVLAGRKAEFTIEYPCHSPNEQRWFMLHATPLAGDAGGAVLAHVNITKRKRAETALRESELRYRRLFESAKDGVLILDAETGMVVDVNPFLIELLGFSRGQFLQKKVWELGFLKDIFANRANFLKLQETGYVRYEDLPLKTADGRQCHVEFVSNVYLVDRQKVIQCNIRDVTERKRAEAEIIRAKEEWERTFDAVPDLIALINMNHRIIRANRAMAERLGSTPEQLVGQPCYETVHGLSAPADFCPHSKLLASGKAQNAEIVEEHLHGALDVSVTPLRDATGHLVGSVHIARDITERKRTEEQIERLSRFPSENPNPVLRVSAQGVLEYANAGSDSILPAMGAAVGGAVNAEWQARIGETFAKEHPVNIEFPVGDRTFGATLIPVVGHGYVNLYAQDITERKRVEEALRASQEIIEGVINAIPVRVFWKDKNLVYLGCNTAFARDAGFADPKDLIGKDDYQMGWRDQAELYRSDDRQVIESGCSKLLIEEPQTTPEGKTITLLSNKLPLRSSTGEINGLLGTYMDITERKLAENVLRNSEMRYRRLFESAQDGILILDEETGMVADVNPFLAELLGFSHDQFLNKAVWDLGFFKDVWANQTKFLELQQKGYVRYENLPLETAAGRKINVEFVSNVYAVDHRNVIQCNIRDITERKHAEAEHAALNEQLRQVQKMESVGQLAGGVAHDFNNILTGISGYTELALERLETASPMREDLAEVLRLSKRAAELTRQLLAFSRRQALQPQVLNINDMIADTAKMLKRVLGENIDLHFVPAPDLGNVQADPIQMEQVLMNLAINARDAMPAGGKLTIETVNVELDAEYAASHISVVPGRYVMMAVSDTGHGMDAATRSRLFEPFFTTKDKSKGTGLGLATTYGIVKQHGGNIWVYTEPGKGATFKIYLPLVEEAVSIVKPAAELDFQRGEETILIVEDESAVRTVAERTLKARGYALLTASNAEEAEVLFSAHPGRISLLLTDIVLPGINGPRLYDRLRIANPGLKVLYMSGHTGNAAVHQGVLDAGAAFMQKPFTLELIARKVRQVLDS